MSFYLRKEFLPGELVNGKPMVAVVIDDTDQHRRSYFSSIVEAKAFIEDQVRAEGRLSTFEIDKLVKFNSQLDAQWLIGVSVADRNRWLAAVDGEKRNQWIAAIEALEAERL